MLRRHALFAGAFALLPLAGIVGGRRGGPTFAMYSSIVEFRLELGGHCGGSTRKAVALNPTSLAPDLPPSARPFVAGADHFRRTTDVATLHRHLDDLGKLACMKFSALDDVEVVLFEREGGVTERTIARVRCSR
jgi:hypothetical protein